LIIIIVVAILLWNKSHQMSGKIMRKESGLSTQRKEIKPLQAIRHEPEPITPPTPVIRTYQRPEQPQPVKQMQEAAPVKKEKAARQEKIISLHHYFHLRNGKSLKSLEELYSEIKAMDHEEYTHHVNHSKNDFANWVLHVLEKPVLAGQLFKTTTKQETLELIKNELDQR
jgi:hypothetical protein